jgi:hypothetical protein
MSARLPLGDIEFIADFATYARGRVPSEPYDYSSIDNCACCQFLRDRRGIDQPRVGGDSWGQIGNPSQEPLPEALADALVKRERGPNDGRTWGRLADRLEALIADTPSVSRVMGGGK